MNDEHQLHTGAPIPTKRGKARHVAFLILFIALGVGTYAGIRWYDAPQQQLLRSLMEIKEKEAVLDVEINERRQALEYHEEGMIEAQKRITEINAELGALKIERDKMVNTGVQNAAPIVPLADAPQ